MPRTTPKAAPAKATTVRLDSRVLKRLARTRNRSRTAVINEALDRYLDYEQPSFKSLPGD